MNGKTFNRVIPNEKNRKEIFEYLESEYQFLNHGIIASSLCGRTIDYIQIGNPHEQVLFAGAFHGMEWLTTLLLLRLTEDICNTIENRQAISSIHIDRFLKKRGLIIIPCVNPDGVEISLYGSKAAYKYKDLVDKISNYDTSRWQANARGVDLNHNFDAGWNELHSLEISKGILGPAITRYGGKHPESEPESSAIARLCRYSHIRHAIAFHSQGEEIYWDFSDKTPKNSRLMADIMAMSSGYKVSTPEGLAVGGGFKDWFIKAFMRPAFTVEIGKGTNPLPIDDIDDIYDRLKEMLILSIIM